MTQLVHDLPSLANAAVQVAAASTSSKGSAFAGILPLLLLGAVLLFVMSRSSRKRQAAARALQSAVSVGSEVMTGGGLFGTVRGLDDESVQLEIAPGVVVRYAKAAITRVISSDPPAQPSPAADPTDA